MMAQNKRSKSVGEAKTTSRQLAACSKTGAAAPAPRYKPKAPASPDQLSWRRVDDEDENATFQPFTATFSIGHNTSILPKSSRRRRYTAEEKLQVAETRRRGACEECRASRTKCLHGSSAVAVAVAVATDQYRMQSESHEIFALGLTTPSLTANEDGHKQVMKETIAAIDNKLVVTQKESSEQNQGTNKKPSGEAANVRVLVSPPETAAGEELLSQQRRFIPKIHNSDTSHSTAIKFEEGINKFRVFDGRTQKLGKKKLQHIDIPKTLKESTLGTKKTVGGRAPARSQAPARRKLPIHVSATSTPVKRPYSEDLPTWRPELQANGDASCPDRQKHVPLGYRMSPPPALKKSLEAPSYFPYRDKPESSSPRRTSSCSDQNSQTMAMDENMTSSGRSASTMSERSPSNPRSFVYLPELSLRSTTPDHEHAQAPISKSPELPAQDQSPPMSPDLLAMTDIESFHVKSFTDFLNSNRSPYCVVASPNGDLSLVGDSGKIELPEQMFEFAPNFMDIDEDN